MYLSLTVSYITFVCTKLFEIRNIHAACYMPCAINIMHLCRLYCIMLCTPIQWVSSDYSLLSCYIQWPLYTFQRTNIIIDQVAIIILQNNVSSHTCTMCIVYLTYQRHHCVTVASPWVIIVPTFYITNLVFQSKTLQQADIDAVAETIDFYR